MADLDTTATKEWIRRRADAVREVCTAYQILTEKGIDNVPDETTPTQIACAFHGADAKPSARYYPRTGTRPDYVRCFKCRENWDCISLHARFQGMRWMDALVDLERRFRVKVARRPEGPPITEPADRGSDYISDQWYDIPRVLALFEQKLLRKRDLISLTEYVKYSRLLDAIEYDFNKTGKPTDDMVAVLRRALGRIDEVIDMNRALQDETHNSE